MALGKTFSQVIEAVRDECGTSSNSSRSVDNLPYLKRLINRVYETIYDGFDWTFLRIDNDEATKTLQAGQVYYDFPVAMSLDTTLTADTFYGNIWVPLIYGISPMDYNAMDPAHNQRADPQQKWRVVTDANGAVQFEVWPMPASDGNLVRFKGRRGFVEMVNDADICRVDHIVVSLYVAAEVLAKKSQKDADLKVAAAKNRMAELRSSYSDRKRVRVGMGRSWMEDQRGWPRIRAFPASN